jgi:hypothetical protein
VCYPIEQANSEDLVTTHQFYQYFLRGFLDPRNNTPIDGMIYKNNPLSNCSVQLVELKQTLWAAVEDQVRNFTDAS